MSTPAAPGEPGLPDSGEPGLTVIRRLHRLVRAGYRPWLGYPAVGGEDGTVPLRRRDGAALLRPDGTVELQATGRVIAGTDAAGFDAAFPPDRPNRRNLVRRLYEIGFLAP